MAGITDYFGVQPQLRNYLKTLENGLSSDVQINIMTANVTTDAQDGPWQYTITFELVDSTGNRHVWWSGTIDATVSDTSTGGTATISTATPAVVNGIGSLIVNEADADAWLAGEVATVTLNGTIPSINKTLTDAEFTVTFA